MKKVIYKILFVILFALLINCIFIQENYAYVIDFEAESKKAEKELNSGELRVIIQQKNSSDRMSKDIEVKATPKELSSAEGGVVNIKLKNITLKKEEYTDIFFYWEEKFNIANTGKNSYTTKITNSDEFNHINYAKTICEGNLFDNTSVAGQLEITSFKKSGEQTIKLKINNSTPDTSQRTTLNLNITVNVLEPRYRAYMNALKESGKDNVQAHEVGPATDAREQQFDVRASLTAQRESKKIAKVAAKDQDSFKVFENQSLEYKKVEGYEDKIAIKTISYEVQKANGTEWLYNFKYGLFPEDDKIVMYYETQEVTGMTDEEKQEVNDEMNEEMDSEIEKAFIKAIVEQLQGEDRWEIVFNDVLKDINNYLPGDGDGMTEEDKKEVSSKASIVLTVITNIGMVLSVVMLAVIGIKYMMGSVEQRADYKQDLVPYVVGAVMLFGISTIAEILKLIGENINNI